MTVHKSQGSEFRQILLILPDRESPVVTREHDTGQRITTVGPAARLARTPAAPGRPAASPGADAASVLRDLGLEHRLEALMAEGVVAIERLPVARSTD